MNEAKLTVVTDNGKIKTLFVRFVGADGQFVSLAFDHRGDTTISGQYAQTEYGIFRDCPVQTETIDNAPLSQLAALLSELK